jgi:hypothetical protein
MRGKDGVKATERGAWLHATPVQLLAAAAAVAGARRIDGSGTADGGARARPCPCAGSNHAWGRCCGRAWLGEEEGEVKIMPSDASLQVLPGLYWALNGLSSANWGLDFGKSS